MGAIYNIVLFIINLFFSLVLFIVILRLLFQMCRAPAGNPFCEGIAKLTNPVILPLRKLVPRTRYIDISTLIVWLVIDVIKYCVVIYMTHQHILTLFQLALIVPADLIMQTSTILLYTVLFYALLKFVAPGMQNTAISTLRILAEPVLKISRKFIPAVSGFDFSPIVAIVVLKAIQIAITTYIPASYFF